MTVNLQRMTDLAGTIPFEDISNSKCIIENYCTNDIAVITSNKSTNISNGTHCHNSYEFIISYSKIPAAPIDNKLYDRKENTLFAINPMQSHGISRAIKGFSVCGIHVDKSFFQRVASDILGSSNIIFSNESFSMSHDINMLVRLFLEELKFKQLGHEFITDNLSILIVCNMIRQIKHNLPSKLHNSRRTNKENIQKVIDYMNENYSVGISCTELSELIKMDKFTFIRSFKEQTSKTPYEYLLDLKIEKAKKMLKANDYSITEISLLCGFSSHSHFTTTFKKKTGLSPRDYTKSLN